VDDPRENRPLADDPNFLASLTELDRGLDGEDIDLRERPSVQTPRPTPRASMPRPTAAPPPGAHAVPQPPPILAPKRPRPSSPRVPLPPSIISPFDALAMTEPQADARPLPGPPVSVPAAAESGHRRRLIDLFPPIAPGDEGTLPATAPAAADFDLRPRSPLEGRLSDPPAQPPTDVAAYEIFYGFDEKPFALSSDPRFFYHSTPHDVVSQQLLTATRKREGLVVLTGDIGTGKTTLCRTVIEQLDRRTLTSFVSDPFVTGEDLLKTILADFGVASRAELSRGSATRHELSTTLISFVESLASLQASAIVIIDEAQNLPPDVIEQVRILTEAGEASALLQVVLVGQPELNTLLRRREHKALQQRVTVRCTLLPLPANEIDGYVMHRLAVAGSGPRVEFDLPALERIFRLSMGVPRLVNLLCERALTRGCEASASVIDASLIEAAAEDLDLGEPRSIARHIASGVAKVVALALCTLAGAGLAAWVFHDAFTRALAQFHR
jgi:type II secretory pathway predicted ATPase ExeA